MANNTSPISQLPLGSATLTGTEVVPVVQSGQTVKMPLALMQGPKGDTGLQGLQGAQGVKGDKGDKGDIGATGAAGAKGDKGDKGDTGATGTNGTNGKDGTNIRLLGTQTDTASLPDTGNNLGDTWFVDSEGWTWNGSQWESIGSFVGKDGVSVSIIGVFASVPALPPAGSNPNALAMVGSVLYGSNGTTWTNLGDLKGPQGAGLIAKGTLAAVGNLPTASLANAAWVYMVAGSMYVSDGSTWVNLGNLVGPQGIQGVKGDQGIKGDKGDKGIQGDRGLGIQIIERLDDVSQLPDAADYGNGDTFVINGHYHTVSAGVWVDLGDMSGPQGLSNYDLWLKEGNQGTVEEFLDAQKGADGIGLQIRGSFNSTADLPTQDMVNGDAYIISQQMYVWDGTQWSIVGQVGPKGDTGSQGPKGDTGSKGDKGDQGIQGVKGDVGPKGDKGDQGIQGDMGPGITILGKLDAEGELPASAELGQGYLIAGDFWGWDGDSFENMGPIQGPKGDQGIQGPKGDTGDKGDKGDTGTTGAAGAKGDTGAKGDKGDTGNTGASLIPKGPIANAAALPAAAAGNAGWMYVTIDDKHSHVSDGTTWVDYGSFAGAQGAQGVKGDKGDTGEKGADGPVGPGVLAKGQVANYAALPAAAAGNAGWYYTLADTKHSWISSGTAWVDMGDLSGAQGIQGVKGDKGDIGAGLVPKGAIASSTALPAVGAGNLGWIYVTADTLHSWVSNGTAWLDLGSLQGPKGDTGSQGVKGDTGAKGDKGDKGDTGSQGPQGVQGDTGIDGPKGDSVSFKGFVADDAALPATGQVVGDTWAVGTHLKTWNGTAWVDMGDFVGPAGPQGEKGDIGAGIKILGKKATVGDLPATADNIGDGYMVGTNFHVWDGAAFVDVGVIQGPKGDQGIRGLTGVKGDTGDKGNKGDKGDAGTKWIVLAGDPNSATGVVGDFYLRTDNLDYFQKTDTATWSKLGKLGGGNVYDATFDGVRKVRKDGQWVDLVFDFDRYDLKLIQPAGTTLDFALGNGFKLSGTTTKALTITNLPAATRIATIVIVLEGKGGNITFTNPISWSRGETPVLGDTRTVIALLWDGANLTGQTSMTV